MNAWIIFVMFTAGIGIGFRLGWSCSEEYWTKKLKQAVQNPEA